MITIQISKQTKKEEIPPCIATVGFFDGVHIGHRFLLNELKTLAKSQNLPAAVITFKHHPRQVLQKEYQPKLLNSLEERLEQLQTTGVDYCLLLDFTIELAALSARTFIVNILSNLLHVRTLLIGYDHRFGHDRTDGFEQYTAYGKEANLQVVKVRPFVQGELKASSSAIRLFIEKGEMEQANALLSYPYKLSGTVVKGHQIGRTLGFPTANIALQNPNKLCPCKGVYLVRVSIENQSYKGMLYIGNRPTLGNGDNSIEVHILNFNEDIYGKSIDIHFHVFIRSSIKFESLELLHLQLEKDKTRVIQSPITIYP